MEKIPETIQELSLRLVSPAVENFMVIDGKTFATGKDGKGLYMLVPKEEAYFYNEAVPINERFRLKKCLSEQKKKEAVISEIKKIKELQDS